MQSRLLHSTLFLACLLLLSACQDSPSHATLTGHLVLPADTFTPGPAVGAALPPEINGRQLPLTSPPVQGFSSLVKLPDDHWLALQDNGFGTLANSPDFPLQFFELDLDFPNDKVKVIGVTAITDPNGLLGFPHAHQHDQGALYGNDLDPESCVRLNDGTLWIGDEFGPFLLPVDADGKVLGPAVPIPVIFQLADHARGTTVLRTPDHPDLRHLATEEERLAAANLPRSGGIEGLARTPDGSRLYASVEKPMLDDPIKDRRVILEFDPAQATFTGRSWLYRTDDPGVSIASLEAYSSTVLLVLERDGDQGAEAVIKRIYRIDLEDADPAGYLHKTLVCDLLDIADPAGITSAAPGIVGFGPVFSFPFVTPECLVILDDHTLMVANDNNYPFSTGRRPPSTPDDNEFARLQLPRSLGD